MDDPVTDKPVRRARSAVRGSLSVALVLALAGTLFVANARLARSGDDRHPQDLRGLATVENDRVSELTETLDALRADVDELAANLNAATSPVDPDRAARVALAAGAAPVSGPGVTVVLDDADPPPGTLDDGTYTADDYVVHQQDLQAVINALWAGGAEAMTIQGQRVTTTTAVRCVGNVLLLQGNVHSPPYTISAIGDPDALRASLDADDSIARYRQWVALIGLGWAVSAEQQITMAAYQGSTSLGWAELPAGVSPFDAGDLTPPSKEGST